MAPYRLYFIGAHILFLAHMANTFILLTANMEDVKKIAQKFVSESLAEKIAEFVAKATEQMVANVSHEDDENAVQYLSDEHSNLQNIGRQREETNALETPKHVEKDTEKYNAQDIDWEKEINEVFTVKENDISNVPKDNEQTKEKKDYEDVDQKDNEKDYDQQRADYEQSKIDDKNKVEEQHKRDYEEQKIIYEQQIKHESTDNPKAELKPKYQLKINYTQKFDKSKRIYPKLRKPRKDRTTRKTIDSTILYQHPKINRLSFNKDVKSKTTFRGFNIQRALTTEKARIEFDQYDNRNYYKSEFIATSGPVVLPRVDMMKPWWEKEMKMPVEKK